MYNYRYILHTYICMCISIYTYYFALFWLTGLFCFIYWLWFVFSLLYIQLCFIMLVYKKVKIFVCSRSFFPFASVVRLFLSLCVERVCPNCTLHIVSRYGNLKKNKTKNCNESSEQVYKEEQTSQEEEDEDDDEGGGTRINKNKTGVFVARSS